MYFICCCVSDTVCITKSKYKTSASMDREKKQHTIPTTKSNLLPSNFSILILLIVLVFI